MFPSAASSPNHAPSLCGTWLQRADPGQVLGTRQVQHVSQIAAVPETIERKMTLFRFTPFSPRAVEYKFLFGLLAPGAPSPNPRGRTMKKMRSIFKAGQVLEVSPVSTLTRLAVTMIPHSRRCISPAPLRALSPAHLLPKPPTPLRDIRSCTIRDLSAVNEPKLV